MKEIQHNKLYKREFFIVFYDKTDTWLKYMFNNAKDILQFMGKPLTRQNINLVNVELYRALKTDTHFTRFLNGEVLRVYIINNKGDD